MVRIKATDDNLSYTSVKAEEYGIREANVRRDVYERTGWHKFADGVHANLNADSTVQDYAMYVSDMCRLVERRATLKA